MISLETSDYPVSQSFADYFEMMNISEELSQYNDGVDNDPVKTYRNFTSEWGPNRDPLYIVIPITVMYIIIFITGVIGNISTCVVISRNKSMHTATNYYLFSLAVSDLLLLISGLPPEMYYIWSKYPYVFGEAFCVIQGFAAETSSNATVLTITAFTIERYVAICHPFLSHTMSKLSRAIKFVMAIWLLALCLAIPQAMSFGIVYQEMDDGVVLDNDHYVCAVKRELVPHAFEISTLVFFVAPMSLISILYVLIALQLRKSKLVKRGSKDTSIELKHRMPKSPGMQSSMKQTVTERSNGGTRGLTGMATPAPTHEDGRKNYHRNMHSRATKHVVNMLVAVVVAFFICWAPFHAQRLLAVHGSAIITPDIIALYTALTYMSGVLYYLSTCINPFLYNIMSHKFRNAFRDTLSRYFPVGGRTRKPTRRYSTLSLPRSISPTRSQSLSHSGGTSRQASLRYIDGDMSRRPLVVSFRRPHTNSTTCTHSARCGCAKNSDVRRAIYSGRIDHQIAEEIDLREMGEEKIVKYKFKYNKSKKLKKWRRKKREAQMYYSDSLPCKVVCSECHKFLNNDTCSEVDKKIVVFKRGTIVSENSCVVSDTFNSSSDASREYKSSPGELNIFSEDLNVDSDLVPRHCCPNQFSSLEIKNKNQASASSLFTNIRCRTDQLNSCDKFQGDVQHSKTMPDIVNHTTQPKELVMDPKKSQNGLHHKLITLQKIYVLDKLNETNSLLDRVCNMQIELDHTSKYENLYKRKWRSVDTIFIK